MRTSVKLAVTILFILIGAWSAREALDFPITGRLMPLFGALVIMVASGLSAILLARQVVVERRAAAARPASDHGDGVVPGPLGEATKKVGALGEGHMQDLPPASRSLRYVGWLVLCLGLVASLGTWIGAAAFLAMFVWWELPEERRFFFVLTGITLGVAVVLVFLLDIEVPGGLLL